MCVRGNTYHCDVTHITSHKICIFSVSHWFWPKKEREKVFLVFWTEKIAFLDNKKLIYGSRMICSFAKGLFYGFGQKYEIYLFYKFLFLKKKKSYIVY